MTNSDLYAPIGYERMTQEEMEAQEPWTTPHGLVESGREWTEFRCANWWICGSTQSHVVIRDRYDDASEMHMCNTCIVDENIREVEHDIIRRRRVVNVKGKKCAAIRSDGFRSGLKCGRFGRVYILLGNRPRYFCLAHGSVQSMWTDVYRFSAMLRDRVNCTEDLQMFYDEHVTRHGSNI